MNLSLPPAVSRKVRLLVCLALAGALARVTAADDLPLPTTTQLVWLELEVGMFCHFGINTFHNLEWSEGNLDPKTFNPTKLDAEQWARVAKSMGAKYLMFTAKHHDGFCLWPTETTDYSIKSSLYKEGKGDIVNEVVTACRKQGILPGLYLSPWDRHEPSYKDKAAYDQFYIRQLTELCTRYGPLVEIWFDGAGSEGREYDWPGIIAVTKKQQPQAMIFNMGKPTIRWSGNEEGFASYPNWNVVPKAEVLNFSTGKGKTDGSGTVWLSVECDVPLRRGWFYHTDNEATIKPLAKLMEIYDKSVGRGANLLLNIAPDRDGLIPEGDAKRAKEFGDEIKRRYVKPLASKSDSGFTLTIHLDKPEKINCALTREYLYQGERVRAYVIEAEVDGTWKPLCTGTSIGHKKIDHFDATETSTVRVRVTESLDLPQFRSFAVYRID
ncbi:MAG: alpha-L-fucosidase [Verrucomicrobia bacterium]|nr:alpha-L-fucosidase [Verrucomicrobiota bacterium]